MNGFPGSRLKHSVLLKEGNRAWVGDAETILGVKELQDNCSLPTMVVPFDERYHQRPIPASVSTSIQKKQTVWKGMTDS